MDGRRIQVRTPELIVCDIIEKKGVFMSETIGRTNSTISAKNRPQCLRCVFTKPNSIIFILEN